MSRRAALTLSAIGILAAVGTLALALAGAVPSASMPDRKLIGTPPVTALGNTDDGASGSPTPSAIATPDPRAIMQGGDGWIAFAMNDERTARGDAGIFVTRLGATPRRIIGAIDDDIREACPTFSPDGRLLAYGEVSLEVPASAAVVIVSVDERGQPSPLRRMPGGEANPPCPKWSPDGSSLAWIDETKLWIAPLEGRATSLDLTPDRGGSEQDIAWTRDGAAIALALSDQVMLVPINGGEPRLLMTADAGDQRDQFHTVAASPTDATLVIAGKRRPGTGGFVRVVDGNGRVLLEVTGDFSAQLPYGTGRPAWSPDGTRLAWGSNRGLEIVALEGDAPGTIDGGPWLAEGGSSISLGSSVRWSPDGMRLLFIGYNGYHRALASIAVDAPSEPIVLTDWGFELDAETGEDLAWQSTSP